MSIEQQLIKLAHQLDGFDEASLMELWERYANTVGNFEPTRQWEEDALVFALIQAKRWKNQLFNQQFAECVQNEKPPKPRPLQKDTHEYTMFPQHHARTEASPTRGASSKKRCQLLPFRPIEKG